MDKVIHPLKPIFTYCDITKTFTEIIWSYPIFPSDCYCFRSIQNRPVSVLNAAASGRCYRHPVRWGLFISGPGIVGTLSVTERSIVIVSSTRIHSEFPP